MVVKGWRDSLLPRGPVFQGVEIDAAEVGNNGGSGHHAGLLVWTGFSALEQGRDEELGEVEVAWRASTVSARGHGVLVCLSVHTEDVGTELKVVALCRHLLNRGSHDTAERDGNLAIMAIVTGG